MQAPFSFFAYLCRINHDFSNQSMNNTTVPPASMRPRWANHRMTSGRFMLRRIIRLQPMVVLGAVLGLAAYIIGGCQRWDGAAVSAWPMAVAFILAILVLPVFPGTDADVRGNNEMFPLNGPEWSLFFEYIGSLLYAFILHKLSDRALRTVVVLSAIGLAACALDNLSGGYTTGFGWSIAANGINGIGFIGGFFHLPWLQTHAHPRCILDMLRNDCGAMHMPVYHNRRRSLDSQCRI